MRAVPNSVETCEGILGPALERWLTAHPCTTAAAFYAGAEAVINAIDAPTSDEDATLAREPPLAVKPKVAARMLSCGLSRLYGLMAKGQIESYLDGRSRHITVASITAYIDRRLIATKAEMPARKAAWAARRARWAARKQVSTMQPPETITPRR